MSSVGVEYVDDEYVLLRDRVELYGESWWIHDEAAQSIWRFQPEVRERLAAIVEAGQSVQTSDVYMEDSNWRERRLLLHRNVVRQLLPEPANSRSEARPPAFLLLGAPGTGKSSSLRHLAQADDLAEAVPLDADDVRVRIPEYRDGLGSEVVQDESTYITYGELRDRCLSGNPYPSGVCVDMVGDPAWVLDYWTKLDAAGYRVYVLATRCPIEQAIQRVKQRAVETGRFVDLDYVRSIGDRPERAMRTLVAAHESGATKLAGWGLFDTSDGQVKGSPLVVDGDGTFGESGALASRLRN